MALKTRIRNVLSILYLTAWGAALLGVAWLAAAQPASDAFSPEDADLINEHVYGGLPSADNVHVRQGYVIGYNPTTRTPNWVAYHVKPDYRKMPSRKKWAKTFRVDPDINNEAKDSEYVGLHAKRGYARGHLAPFAVMGGDRNGNGVYAEVNDNNPSDQGDPHDALTIRQGNYMSNIAPQHHEGFNGWEKIAGQQVPGLWFELERWIQDTVVKVGGNEAWVFAGCVFGHGDHEKVGPNADIWVPPMFYKIVIMKDPDEDVELPIVLAYLFPHQRKRHGDLDDFLVSVDVIEALSGVDFFNSLDDELEEKIEDRDSWEVAYAHFYEEDIQ